MTNLAAPLTRRLMSASYRSSSRDHDRVPRPPGVGQVHATGSEPANVLLIGSGAATGLGVMSHELALAGHLARGLASRIGCGVDVSVHAEVEPSVMAPETVRLAFDLSQFDLIVVTLGAADAYRLMPPDQWERRVAALLRTIEGAAAATAAIVVVGIPPMAKALPSPMHFTAVAERHADVLNEVTRAWCSRAGRFSFMTLAEPTDDDPRRICTPETYRQWSEAITDAIMRDRALLGTVQHGSHRGHVQDETQRQRAVTSLRFLTDSETDAALQRIVTAARTAFGAASAAITLIDGDRQLYAARAGFDREELPREDAFCATTILGSTALIVPDASKDTRFVESSLVQDGEVGFYAGFPIESPDGYRIGALCVFDPEPRNAADVSPVLLRDLALMAQTEIGRMATAIRRRRTVKAATAEVARV